MSLVNRNGVYESHVCVDGVRHRKSTGTKNRRLAEQIDRKFKDELIAQRNQISNFNPEMIFGELAAQFIASGEVKAWHLGRLKMLLPYYADKAIGQIGRSNARQYRLERHRQKKLTETTINRDLECLRHIFFWAVDEGILAGNPLARLPLERERKRKRPVLSVEEEGRLLPAAAPHLQPIIITGLDTGMRRGEILSQDWQDIDFPRRLLFVTHSKTPEGESREIPLSDRLFELLSSKRKQSGLVFTFKDKPLHRIKTAWKAAIRRSQIRPLRFHDLRHSFNCRLIEAGVMQEVRKALMGHSSGEDVHSTYVHIELPAKREAIRKLEAWLASQTQTDTNTTFEKEEKTYESGESRSGGTDDSFERSGRDSGSKAQV